MTDQHRSEIKTVFYYLADPPVSGQDEAQRLAVSVESIESWLRHFARWFLDDAHVFNSLKHGLAIRPGEASMSLTTPLDEEKGLDPPLIHADGPSIEFLEKWGEPPLWHQATRWVKPRNLIIEAEIATSLLHQVWQVGRGRYVDRDEPMKLRFRDKPTYGEYIDAAVLEGDKGRLIFNTARVNLLYEYAFPPELVCIACGREPRTDERPYRTWKAYNDGTGRVTVHCAECAAAMGE